MLNLVTNAIKFAPKESNINIKLNLMPDKDISYSIDVTDLGIGISLEDQKNLFTSNFKTKDETS